MFNSRKAKKLRLKDLGKEVLIIHHVIYGSRIRVGKDLKTGKIVQWCPRCEIRFDN